MLEPQRVANALALTVAIGRLIAAILAYLTPDLFAFLYKAGTMGLDTRFINPTGQEVVISTLIPAAGAWVIGYLGASVYNRLR